MKNWGNGIQECDIFAETLDKFQALTKKGIRAKRAYSLVLQEYDTSPESHIVKLALLYGLSLRGKLNDSSIKTLKNIVNSDIDGEYLKGCGANNDQLLLRRKELLSFINGMLTAPEKYKTPTSKSDSFFINPAIK